MANEVEIRFRITNEKTTPQAATPTGSSVPSAVARTLQTPQEFSQRERDVEEKLQKMEHHHSALEKFEHRIEHKMKHLGAKLVAMAAVEEIGGALGIENSFVGRLGEHAIEGAMMGGPVMAAMKSLTCIVHELISQVKGHGEEVKRLRELQIKKEEKAQDDMLSLRYETNEKLRKQQEETEEAVRAYHQRALDYSLNAVKYITTPYTGVG